MVNGRLKSVKHVQPASESIVRYHLPCYHTQQLNQVSSTLLSNTARYQAQLDPQVHRIRKLWFAFDINVATSATDLPPTWAWLDRISWRSNAGSTALFDSYPSDVTPLRLAAQLARSHSDKQPQVLSSMNATSFASTATTLQPGNYRFYLPILDIFDGLVIERLTGEICADLYPAGIFPNNVTLTSLQWVVQTDAIQPDERASSMKALRLAVHSRSVMEPVRYELIGRTLSANTEFHVDLDSFTGHSMGLLVYVRDSSGQSIDLGAGAECDLESASGRSLFGQGSLVPIDLLQSWGDQFSNTFVEEVPSLILPFTDDLVSALRHGVRSGCFQFTGNRDRLVLKPGPNFPSGQYSITVYMLKYARISRWDDRLSQAND